MMSSQESGKKPSFYLKSLAWGLALVFTVQFAVGLWVAAVIQSRLEIQIKGRFWPVPLASSFFSNRAELDWKNHVTILSGKLKIDYNVFPLLVKNSIRVKVHGKNIRAKLSGDWQRMQGVENIEIDEFEADLEIARRGLGEIYLVRAQSPSFQFHIEKNVS